MPTLLTPQRDFATVRTTDATVTVILSYTQPNNTVVYARALFFSLRSDNAAAVGATAYAVFRNNAGTTTQVGTTGFPESREDQAVNVNLRNTGAVIEATVQGLAATTYDHACVLEVYVYAI